MSGPFFRAGAELLEGVEAAVAVRGIDPGLAALLEDAPDVLDAAVGVLPVIAGSVLPTDLGGVVRVADVEDGLVHPD